MSDKSEKRKKVKQLQAIPFALVFFGVIALIEMQATWWWVPTFIGIFGFAGLKSWLFELKDH